MSAKGLNNDFIEIYYTLTLNNQNVAERKASLQLRDSKLQSLTMVKLAFDTRRINQQTDFNPRRGLQYYQRSESFVSEASSKKIKTFEKLFKILEELKETYGYEPEWQDSYTRLLFNILETALRKKIGDDDIGENQQSLSSLYYVEELLHVRYRLTCEQVDSLSDKELKELILNKDKELVNKKMPNKSVDVITKHDVTGNNYNALFEMLFGVKATQENKNVERSVTITIKDSILDKE